MAMARSYCDPFLRKSAGARLTTIFLFSRLGDFNPLFFRAELTRSLASERALSANPTMVKECNPTLISVSTSTSWAFIPSNSAEKTLEKVKTEDWQKQNLETILLAAAGKTGDRGKLLWPLRVALSGKEASASPFEIAGVLGQEKTLKRIKEARMLLEKNKKNFISRFIRNF